MESRTTTSTDGTRIAWSRQGSGPPLIVIDGAFCSRGYGPAAGLAAALAPRFTVFTYDRRGRGESHSDGPYTVEREVADLRAVAGEAGAPPVLLGVSSGAALALQAVAAGLSAARLVLYEPPYVERPMGAYKAQLEALLARGDRAGAVRYFLTTVMGAPAFFAFLMPLVMRRAWKSNVAVAHTLPGDLALLEDVSVLSDRVRVPALVVAGEKSPQALRDAVTRVAGALPHAERRSLAGATHNLPPARLAELLT